VPARVRTVVAAWGASPRLEAALDSIERATRPYFGEIVVVGDPAVPNIAAAKSRATLVPSDPAQPSTPGSHRNQGARGATTPYLLFADDDVVLQEGFVNRAIALLDREADVVAAGGRIHERRIAIGLTLRELGRMVELSQTQVHKFECGKNRVSVGLLYKISRVLDAPISYFFDGLQDAETPSGVPRRRTLTEAVQSFSKIQNEKHQEAFSHLVRILAEG